ncbi:MipA/OmpV family protein [Novosphingobium sp.]|uniref:MipA/OmpV family protein n=1 Tax=Novosphingobium sp. TaxID=1874826 RepID=UPI003BAC9904
MTNTNHANTLSRFLLTVAALCMSPGLARAEAANGKDASANLRFEAGAAMLAVPLYPGADAMRTLALPDISITVGDRVFASLATGIGAALIDRRGLTLGVVARPDFGRRQRDVDRTYPGLPAIAATAELGWFAAVRIGSVLTWRGEVRRAVSGHGGTVADLSLTFAHPLGKRLILAVTPEVRIADARFMRAYFGTDRAAFAETGLQAYRPNGGLERVGLGISAVRPLAKRLVLTASLQYDRLVGGAARSPIVRGPHGSPDQAVGLIGLRYRFR